MFFCRGERAKSRFELGLGLTVWGADALGDYSEPEHRMALQYVAQMCGSVSTKGRVGVITLVFYIA